MIAYASVVLQLEVLVGCYFLKEDLINNNVVNDGSRAEYAVFFFFFSGKLFFHASHVCMFLPVLEQFMLFLIIKKLIADHFPRDRRVNPRYYQ